MKMILPAKSLLLKLKVKALALVLIAAGLICTQQVTAQITIATGIPNVAGSGSSSSPSVVLFCIDNPTASPVTLTAIDNYMAATTSNFPWTLLYSATSISGQPNVTTWTTIATTTGPVVTATGIYPLFTGLNFVIPPATVYRFALQITNSLINYGGGGTTPNSITVSGVSLYRGDYLISGLNVGYAGTASAPPFFPRFFAGTVYLNNVTCTGTPNAPTITTAPLTGSLCPNATTSIAASNPSAPAGIGYQWEQAPAAAGPWTNVVGGTGATTLNYTTAALTTTTWFRVKAICGANTAPSTAYQVQIAGISQPGSISGSTAVCSGTNLTYSVAAVAGATSYTWTLPSGWSGTSTTNSITVVAGSPGTISVTATGPCGTSTASTLTVTGSAAPSQPGAINGNATSCQGISQTYSITPVTGATTYNWTLPSGWSGASTTSSITTTTGSAGGTITVTASNSCGTSIPQTLPVTISNLPPTLGAISGNASVCSGSAQIYNVGPVAGVLTYIWSLPSGWTGNSTTNSIPVIAGINGGTISVSADNGCGVSQPQTLAVTVNPQLIPSSSITATATSICAGTAVTFTGTTVNGGSGPSYQWKKNGFNVGTNSTTFTISALASGDIITMVLSSNALCATTPTATSNGISITVSPTVVPGINVNTTTAPTICSGTLVNFFANITGGGSTPAYQWKKNGVSVGGNTPNYSSNILGDGDSVSCILTTNALCALTPTAPSNMMGFTVLPIVNPAVAVTASPGNVIYAGQTVTFTANPSNGGSTPTYQWMKNGAAITGENGLTYTTSDLADEDQISMQLTSTALCANPVVKMSNLVTIKVPTAVSNVSSNISFSLSPNPNSGHFTLRADWEGLKAGSKVKIEVLNTVGQVVYLTEVIPGRSKWNTDINLSEGISNGLYLVKVSSDGMQVTKRFEIRR